MGSIFVTGFFQGSDRFGSRLLISAGAADIFIAKYNLNGLCTNARRFGNLQDDYGYRIKRYNNRLWLMGSYPDFIKIGSYTLTSAMGLECFLAEFDPLTFVPVYAENLAITRTGAMEGEDLAITQQGDVYVTGYYSDDATLNPHIFNTSIGGSYDIYFAKLPFSSTKSSVAEQIMPSDTNMVSISVFPNPADDFIYIRTKEIKEQNIKIAVYNTSGQLVMTQHTNDHAGLITLDLKSIEPGLYQLILLSGDIIIASERIIRR